MSISVCDGYSDDKKIQVLVIVNSLPQVKRAGNPAINDQLQELERRGVDFHLVSIKAGNIASYLLALWTILMLNFQRKRYDLIHAYYGHCGLLACLQAKYPIVVTFLGSDITGNGLNGYHDRLIGRAVAKLVDVSIVMSEDMAKFVPWHKTRIIPFGVDTKTFFPQSQNQARRSLGLPINEELILFPWDPARKEKKFDLVLAVMDILKQHYPIRLITVYDQPHHKLVEYMNACDVLIVASEHEGSPMAVREALACNLPVVSVDAGDIANLIDGVENCYITSRDPKDMANKVKQILKDGRRSTGEEKGRSMDIKWAANQVYAIYESLLSNK